MFHCVTVINDMDRGMVWGNVWGDSFDFYRVYNVTNAVEETQAFDVQFVKEMPAIGSFLSDFHLVLVWKPKGNKRSGPVVFVSVVKGVYRDVDL